MFCSLIVRDPQVIPPNAWTLVRFDEESSDPGNLHRVPDLTRPESALIVPNTTGVGLCSALIQWEEIPRGAQEPDAAYRARITSQFTASQFARDPLGAIDTTGTRDRANTVGVDFETTSWNFILRTGQPVALRVTHNTRDAAGQPAARAVRLAEFKAWIP